MEATGAASCHSGCWVGARVASPHCPILRSGTSRVDHINLAAQWFFIERRLPP